MIKSRNEAGADNCTPSIPQYFSWINNTNEGSTEVQTLINLEFFRWLRENYGMEIKIYAWDAGNFDGASEGYGSTDSAKFKSQYPEGYKNVVAAAEKLGIRFGLWGSPDGYGNTEEEEKKRYEFFVHLCRDYHFALFKLDGVCGTLREEKAPLFAKMLRECRTYSPDLIVLNHRLRLYDAEKYVTTSLMNGEETYTDVLIHNHNTAMHNRAYMFRRGHTENLDRLYEDHGVCLSSCLDYFEDELIYQAFNRSLILAPEIYGNPWFLKDSEFPRLARIYNLHRANAEILVNGMLLPESYGAEAVSRGSKSKRYISTGNNSWETKTISVKLDGEIGLDTCGKIAVNLRHPYEKHVGIFDFGDEVEIELKPFRAALIEVSEAEEADPVLTGCEYEMLRENKDGTPAQVKIVKSDGGKIMLLSGGVLSEFGQCEAVDIREAAPVKLGSLENGEFCNTAFLTETAAFAINNDSLEKRSVNRAGETAIPEVKAARDAFFGQATYRLRGCENRNLFDGQPDTFFDAQSRCYRGVNLRVNGGCLRVDFGREVDADTVELEFFTAKHPTAELPVQTLRDRAEYSADLECWDTCPLGSLDVVRELTIPVVRFTVHTIYEAEGSIVRASYKLGGKIRYFKLPEPVDRIYSVKLKKNGEKIDLAGAKANNMEPAVIPVGALKSGEFKLPEYRSGSKLAVALEGVHGNEEVYCTAEIGGKYYGFPNRAPEYKANIWEHCVVDCDRYYTFYLPLPDGLAGEIAKIYLTIANEEYKNIHCDVYLCDRHD